MRICMRAHAQPAECPPWQEAASNQPAPGSAAPPHAYLGVRGRQVVPLGQPKAQHVLAHLQAAHHKRGWRRLQEPVLGEGGCDGRPS